MRKILLFLCVMFVSGVMNVSAYTYSGTCGANVIWTIDTETGVLKITGSGNMYDYYSSSYPYAPWRDYKSMFTSVTIGSSVTSIGSYAFYNCTGLTSITIPNSVTSIGHGAFEYCSGLTSITIPNSVTSIGDYAFYGCSGLLNINVDATNTNYCSVNGVLFNKDKSTLISYPCGKEGDYIIPNSVTSIGKGAFSGCSGLTSITIPNRVSSIERSAFSGCSGLTSITIPDSVTSIGGWAFRGCSGLTSITIPNRVTSIGDSTFYGCFGLTSVTIGNSVTSIGNYTFYNCTGLTSVTIGNSVTSIGDEAFRYCRGLTSITWNAKYYYDSLSEYADAPFYNFRYQITSFTFGEEVESIPAFLCCGMTQLASITIPNSVTSIGDEAFRYCRGLTSITWNAKNCESPSKYADAPFYYINNQITSFTFGEEVKSIPAFLCYGMTQLASITIPNSVTSIGNSAFHDCSGLLSINVDAANTNYCSISGVLFNKDKSTLISYPCGKEGDYIIPNSVTSIGNSAFYNCTGLTSVTIGNSVTSIGYEAFKGCTGLTAIIWNAKYYYVYLSEYADAPFYNIRSQITSFTFGEEVESISNFLCYGMTQLASITIPNSVTSIGSQAFRGCSGLTSITWNAKNCESPSKYADAPFYYINNQITSFTFGEEVKSIPAFLCYGMTQLASITIPNSVTSIGDHAFYYCTGLTSVTIPNSVTSIGDHAFYYCTGLTSVTIPNSVTSIGGWAFYNCTKLSWVTIGNSVTSIGSSAFEGCSGLTSITIPNSVTSIGSSAFEGCSGLTSITIPNSVTSIGSSAFRDCTGLTSVTIGSSVTSIEDYAFYGCSGLTSITIPNSVTSIGSRAFLGCTGLISVTIPNGVTSIKERAFKGCSGLTSVIIGNNVNSIAKDAFALADNITSVTWNAKNCNCYNFGSQVESFTFGSEVEHIPANLCSGMSKLSSLALPASLKSIGDYAFKGLTKIKKINIPNAVTSIGTHAFDSCIYVTSIYLGHQVTEIGDYAFKGCIRVNDITSMNTTAPIVYDNTLISISNYAYLFVPTGSKRTYQLYHYWSRFDIREIGSSEVTITDSTVTVQANDDNAVFTWPTNNNASTYTLVITKDDVVFCRLVFNANGQLTGIAFAPSRNGRPHNSPTLSSTQSGLQFTVTGLNGASKYAYHLVARDAEETELVSYRGEFATTGYTGDTPGGGDNPGGGGDNPGGGDTPGGGDASALQKVQKNTLQKNKYIRNGQILIQRGEKTYTLQGQEVR